MYRLYTSEAICRSGMVNPGTNVHMHPSTLCMGEEEISYNSTACTNTALMQQHSSSREELQHMHRLYTSEAICRSGMVNPGTNMHMHPSTPYMGEEKSPSPILHAYTSATQVTS